jgi:hypothetical protein
LLTVRKLVHCTSCIFLPCKSHLVASGWEGLNGWVMTWLLELSRWPECFTRAVLIGGAGPAAASSKQLGTH